MAQTIGAVSMELFASSDIKHQRKISHSLSQSLSVNRPLNFPDLKSKLNIKSHISEMKSVAIMKDGFAICI